MWVTDEHAGMYQQFLLVANGFVLAHFLSPSSRTSYERMLTNLGFNGFPENIMNTLRNYSDPVKRLRSSKTKHVTAQQTELVRKNYEKVKLPFRTYKIEVCIYENVVFDPEINPYIQYVVTGNDFVIASFTHEVGAIAYVDYLKKKGFTEFPKDVLDVIHYYSDPSKLLINARKKEIQ